jgi:hypothetical protein
MISMMGTTSAKITAVMTLFFVQAIMVASARNMASQTSLAPSLPALHNSSLAFQQDTHRGRREEENTQSRTGEAHEHVQSTAVGDHHHDMYANFDQSMPGTHVRNPQKDVRRRLHRNRCCFQNCSKRSIYQSVKDQDTSPCHLYFCADHRDNSSTPVRYKTQKCQHDSCGKWPSYGLSQPGKRIPMHCRAHAVEGEVNLKARLCKWEGCPVQATFGKAEEKPEYCRL